MSDVAFRHLAGLAGKRLSRRRVLAGSAAVSAAAIAAPRVIVPARAQDRKKVTFWTSHTDPDLSVLRTIAEEYNAQSTSYEVELIQIPPAEVTDVNRLITAVRGGTGPDVYLLDRFIVAQRAADGLLQDLSGYLSAPLAETHLEFAAAEATFEDKPYALPFDTDARALYYNIDLLQAAGIDTTPFDATNGPLTVEQVREAALALNQENSDGSYRQVGFIPWLNQGWHYTWGFAFGGNFYNPEECQVTPDDPAVVAAFQWVYDYCAEQDPQKLSAFGTPSMQPGAAPQEHPFHVGTLGMQITGDWEIAQMERYAPNTNYGITYIPVPEAGASPSTWAGGWSVVIPQGAKEPDGGYDFMTFIAGEPGQLIYTEQTRHLPTLKSLLARPEIFSERHKFFANELLPIARSRPPIPVGAKYWDELTVAWQAVYLNEQEPEEALAQVKERVQPDLERFC